MLLRLLFCLILFGCSSHELAYRYSSFKRSLAGEGLDKTKVYRIEVSLTNNKLFASGMDSTFIVARLFDKGGMLLTNVDPDSLTLSTDVDIKAKPFILRKGVYKSEILPKVKSPNVRMRVDWRGEVLSEEVFLETVLVPLKDEVPPVNHEYFEIKSLGEVNFTRGSGSPKSSTDGFGFENIGNNKIVNTSKYPEAQRNFNFEYLGQARQNLKVQIEDDVDGKDSNTLGLLFMFFPRKQLPTVEELTGTLNVTLPNGEKLVFRKESKEIVEGVLAEGPLDGKQHPNIKYRGLGVVLRALIKQQSPQDETDEQKIPEDTDVVIVNGATGQRCKRPRTDFWDPMASTFELNFPKDSDLDHYLRSKCGFGLPKL